MTTLFETALRLARKVTHVEEGTASSGDGVSLTDSQAESSGGTYARGTLWILNGVHAGKSRVITTNPKNKYNFLPPLGSVLCANQVVKVTVLGSVTGTGNATVVVTAAGMNGTPKTISVAVTSGDSASVAAGKIRTALKADTDVAAYFNVGGSGADVELTVLAAAANDTTMKITVANGTCTGLTSVQSTITTPGIAGPGYGVTDDEFTRAMFRAAVNEGLKAQAPYAAEDISLTTVAGQEEYALPNGVSDVKKVEIATQTVEPFGFDEHYHWDLVDGAIRFPTKYAPQMAARIIRLTHITDATRLANDTDTIPFGVDEDALFWRAVIALMSDAQVENPDEQRYVNLMNEAQEMYRRTNPNQARIARTPRLADW